MKLIIEGRKSKNDQGLVDSIKVSVTFLCFYFLKALFAQYSLVNSLVSMISVFFIQFYLVLQSARL